MALAGHLTPVFPPGKQWEHLKPNTFPEQAQWAVRRRQILLACGLEHRQRAALKHPHICTDVQSVIGQYGSPSPGLDTHLFSLHSSFLLHSTCQQLAECLINHVPQLCHTFQEGRSWLMSVTAKSPAPRTAQHGSCKVNTGEGRKEWEASEL